jgi:hypothetical protein
MTQRSTKPRAPRYQPGDRVYTRRYGKVHGSVLLCEKYRALVRLDGAGDESIALSDLYPEATKGPTT